MSIRWMLLLCCIAMLFFCGELYAQELVDVVKSIELRSNQTVLRSMAVSEAITRITGTAIYPVFGLAFLGAWDHMNGVEVWYATPFLYGPLIAIMVIDFLKNTLGLAFGPLKKIVDIAVQFLDFINANLGLLMSVGIAMDTLQHPVEEGASALLNIVFPAAQAASTLSGSLTMGSVILMIVAGVLGAVIYFVIWVTMQSFALLILLSPFNILDSILRSIQLCAVTVMGLSFLLFPPLAVCIACAYIFVALYLFRFCWSHLVFSTKVIYFYLFARGSGTVDLEQGISCFSGEGVQGCYPRTSGRLIRRGGQLLFSTPGLMGVGKEYPLDRSLICIHEGIFFATLITKDEHRDIVLLMLTPKMNGQEDALAKEMGCAAVPFTLMNGFRSGFRYLRAQM